MKKNISLFIFTALIPNILFGAAFSDTELSFYRDSITTLSDE
jgi:hypothetical protein